MRRSTGSSGDVADTFNGLMVVPNLLALFLLSGTLVCIIRGNVD